MWPGVWPGVGTAGELAGEQVLTFHELDEPELRERPHAGGRVGVALRLDLRLVAGLPVLGAHPVARVREGRLVPAGVAEEVPADVVAVEVGHDDHVHLLAPHPVGLEVVQEAAPGRVGRVGRLGAEPGVHQHGTAPRADQVGAEIEAHPVRVEMGLVGTPLRFGNRGEEVAEIELQHAVGERHDLDVSDVYDMARHGGPSRCRRCYAIIRRGHNPGVDHAHPGGEGGDVPGAPRAAGRLHHPQSVGRGHRPAPRRASASRPSPPPALASPTRSGAPTGRTR